MKAILCVLLATVGMTLCGLGAIYLFGVYWWWDWGWPGPHTFRRLGLIAFVMSFLVTCISAVNQNRPDVANKGSKPRVVE